jgi:hypothetical protein
MPFEHPTLPLALMAFLGESEPGFFDLSPFQITLVLSLAAAALVLVLSLLYGIHRLVTLPSRRRASTRQFLQILELAVADGRSPESVIVDAAATHDPSLPLRLHMVAAYVERGASLASALSLVPGLLPADVLAMVSAGLRHGHLERVLAPASLAVAENDTRGKAGLSAIFINLTLSTTLTATVAAWASISVVPKYLAILDDMVPAGYSLPPLASWVAAHFPILLLAVAALVPISLALLFARSINPGLRLPGLDLLRLLLPWHRQRAHRSFVALLGLQLDAGAPEEDAVREAAAATGNRWIRARAQRAILELRRGTSLDDAVARIDSRPDFAWRLRNALATPGLASTALRSWVLDLHSRADRTEYIAGQAVALTLFAVQSVLVGGYLCGLFLYLIQIIELATNG